MSKLCAMCAINTVNGRKTFCPSCYFANKEFIDELLQECKQPNFKRPKWLKFMEADTAKESRRLIREMQMVSNWNE